MQDINAILAEMSDDELKRIRSLPMVEYIIGDTSKRGFFDREHSELYCTDEEFGEFTEILKMNSDKADPLKYVSESLATNNDTDSKIDPLKNVFDQIIEDIKKAFTKNRRTERKQSNLMNVSAIKESAANPIVDKENNKKTRNRKKICTLLALLLISIAIAVQFDEYANTDDESNVTKLKSIVVVQVTRDMIPGEVITENDIQKSTLSAQSYNEITLGSSPLYQWNRHDTLINKYVISYIPKGQYLTYENIDTVYIPEPNPWTENTEGFEMVHIPVTKEVIGDADLNYGSELSLKITERTVNESNLDPKNIKSQSALKHESSVEQSYIINTYSLETTICDLLNENGDSLYSIFKSWLSIPAGEQLPYLEKAFTKDATLEKKIEPKYILIKVTAEQADELGEVISDDSEIKYTFNRTYDNDTPAKADFIAEIQALFTTIGKAENAAADARETINDKEE